MAQSYKTLAPVDHVASLRAPSVVVLPISGDPPSVVPHLAAGPASATVNADGVTLAGVIDLDGSRAPHSPLQSGVTCDSSPAKRSSHAQPLQKRSL